MKLQDIMDGESLVLEVEWGENIYEIPTTAVGSSEYGLLIKPVIYNDIVVDLAAGNERDMLFSIHVVDPNTGIRNVWRNVQLKTIVYYGTTYYATRTAKYNADAKSSERRIHGRLPIGLDGKLELNASAGSTDVHIVDLSDGGISFTTAPNIDLDKLPHIIEFKDSVKNTSFSLKMKCIWVRRIVEPNKILWGCKISEADRSVLAYICLRRAYLKAKE